MVAFRATRRAGQEPNGIDARIARARRMAAEQALSSDPGLPLILRKDGVSKRYSRIYTDLTLRALGIAEAVQRTNEGFEDASLPAISLDGQALMAVRKSVTLLTDIAFFMANVNELIDDPTWRHKIVDLYIERVMRPPTQAPANAAVSREQAQLMAMLKQLVQ